MALPRLRAEEIQGVYAIIPTPAKPGAESWQAQDTVDTDEIARVVEQLITDGVRAFLRWARWASAPRSPGTSIKQLSPPLSRRRANGCRSSPAPPASTPATRS